MNRPLVTLSAVALFAAAVLAVLYVRVGNAKQLVDRQLAETTAHADKLSSDLASANDQNAALTTKVGALDTDLGATKGKLAASESRVTELDRILGEAKNLLALQEQNTRALAAEVASLKTDLADTRASNASPEAVTAYQHTIAELERQLAAAGNGAALPTAAGASTAVFMNRIGRATVLSVGPENAFVILDFGTARGAEAGQQLSITHGTELAAMVLISDVRNNFSIAQVQPDSLHGALQKGDSAVLIR
jgi:uncharacterized protein YoxC